jgi:hypothetical protein
MLPQQEAYMTGGHIMSWQTWHLNVVLNRLISERGTGVEFLTSAIACIFSLMKPTSIAIERSFWHDFSLIIRESFEVRSNSEPSD